jgi:hypothetical protein
MTDTAAAPSNEIKHSFTDIKLKKRGTKEEVTVPLLRYERVEDYIAKYSEAGTLALLTEAHDTAMRKILWSQLAKNAESQAMLTSQLVYEAIKPPKVVKPKKEKKIKLSKDAMQKLLAKIASGEITEESLGL